MVASGTRVSCALLGALGCAVAGCTRPPVVNIPPAGAPVRGVTVTGNGEAKAPPDIARTSIGVEMRADTVEQATLQANQRMSAIVDTLKRLGIADKDLRTHSLSIAFEQAPTPPVPLPQAESAPAEPGPRRKAAAPGTMTAPPAPPPAAVRGVYRASNMLEVTVRDLSKTGQVLQAATDAGANNVWGISFELEDPEPLLAQARAKAVEHAKRNAATLAQLNGVRLGPIVSISEGGMAGPVPPMYSMRAEVAQGGDVPIERGEVTVTQQVQIAYALPE